MQNLWGQTKSIVFSEVAYYNDMKWYMKCFIYWYPYNDIPYNGDDVDDVGHDNDDESEWIEMKLLAWKFVVDLAYFI